MSTSSSLGAALQRLFSTIESRRSDGAGESYTASLFARGRRRIAQKVGEEGVETALAAVAGDAEGVVSESADLLYHLCVLWADCGLTPDAIAAELDRREGISGLAEKAARTSKE